MSSPGASCRGAPSSTTPCIHGDELKRLEAGLQPVCVTSGGSSAPSAWKAKSTQQQMAWQTPTLALRRATVPSTILVASSGSCMFAQHSTLLTTACRSSQTARERTDDSSDGARELKRWTSTPHTSPTRWCRRQSSSHSSMQAYTLADRGSMGALAETRPRLTAHRHRRSISARCSPDQLRCNLNIWPHDY